MKMRQGRKGQQGFTLVELLVVVSIIALLAVIAVPKLMTSLDKTKAAKDQADLEAISAALDKFYYDNTFYPQKLQDLVTSGYMKQTDFKNAFGNWYFYAVDDPSNGGTYSATTRTFTAAGSAKAYALGDPGHYPKAPTSGTCALIQADVNAALDSTPYLCQGSDPATLAWNMATKVSTDVAGFPDSTYHSLRGFSKNIFSE